MEPRSLEISIDRGGTFTDVYASWPKPGSNNERQELILKLLSRDPGHYEDAPREGVRRVLEHVTGEAFPRKERLPTDKIAWIRLSTTVGTNALLERQGTKHALVITKGFKDLLAIGNQSRPKIFDLAIKKPEVLYSDVVEVDERVTLVGYTSDPKSKERAVVFDEEGQVVKGYDGTDATNILQGLSGEAVRIIKKPEEQAVHKALQKLYDNGYRSLAVVFLHAYTYPDHERLVGEIAASIGFSQISLSSSISASIKVVPRGISSTCDAYLTPVLREYINGFFDGFDESLRRDVQLEGQEAAQSQRTSVEFMTSDGGLTDVRTFSGLKSILSGPAGGVVGCALTSWDEERQVPVIGFDMGGTSTDVSRYAGSYETVFETTTAGITIQSPQLDINTVAAGGGSRLFWKNSLFTVGPESASAHPGPTCYRKGGPLAVTDANLFLGRLIPKYFPRIFGESEDQPLDVEASAKKFEELCAQINADTKENRSPDEIAFGFLKVANESICRPIRALTEARGFDTTKHILTGFGGASGQHVCAIAKNLGVKTILLHTYSSVLSAYGMALADRMFDQREPCAVTYGPDAVPDLQKRLKRLRETVKKELQQQGFKEENIVLESYLNLRYNGTDNALMTLQRSEDDWDIDQAFVEGYQQEFGFTLEDRSIIVDDARVRGIGKAHSAKFKSPLQEAEETQFQDVDEAKATEKVSVYFEDTGRIDAPLYQLDDLSPGSQVKGPAIILQDTQTTVLDPGCKAKILSRHVLVEM